MKKSSSIDNPFFRLMGAIGDLVVLNILWLLCCLPVVTAGASTLALFAIVHKIVAGEDYRTASGFFKAFRRDFKQATALWLVVLAAGIAALAGLRAASAQDDVFTGLLAAASFLLLAGVCCCGCWGLALLARFTYRHGLLALLDGAAKKADIDLFVLDDGWFKGRNDTSSSLGDWVEDKAKLPDGLPGLCRRLNEMGVELGLWVEPEAVSPNSDLYKAHPDWAFVVPGRRPLEIRQQYTLDFSREEVVDGIWQQLERVLRSCHIKYLKWDMNRSLANVYSAALPAGRQGEVYHRYVLGVYELQRRVTETFPGLLLENCAGGGARFDCGMLYYSPQIWCSDNTDARARLLIQYGTSLFYPGCVMGAHFSTVPNHCNGHISTTEARMAAALSGTFGFELDLTTYTPEELEALRPYVAWYRAHGGLLRGGDLYRLAGPDASALGAAWMIAALDGSEAAVFAVGDALSGSHGTASMNSLPRLPLQGLDPAAVYEDEQGAQYTGAQLMALGLPLPGPRGQTPACIWYLHRV